MAVLLMTCTLLAQVCCSLLQRFIPSGPAALFFSIVRVQNQYIRWLRNSDFHQSNHELGVIPNFFRTKPMWVCLKIVYP
jgi:hypothetical protein